MEKKKSKKEIVRLLLNQDLDVEDEEQLIEMLIDDPIAVDIDRESHDNLKFGDRLSDKLAEKAGSWGFIITFGAFLVLWIILNIKYFNDLDPYPFILLNLLLSCLAAIQAPVIMMSQNRASKKDSMRSYNDYKTDLKSELILEELHHKITEMMSNQRKILKLLEPNDEDSEVK